MIGFRAFSFIQISRLHLYMGFLVKTLQNIFPVKIPAIAGSRKSILIFKKNDEH